MAVIESLIGSNRVTHLGYLLAADSVPTDFLAAADMRWKLHKLHILDGIRGRYLPTDSAFGLINVFYRLFARYLTIAVCFVVYAEHTSTPLRQ